MGSGPLNGIDQSGLIDPSGYQDPTMYSSGGFANPAEFADGLDNGLDGVEQSIGFDPIIGYSAIPIYNEGLRIQPIRALGVIRGFVDLLRVGRGLGQAIYCDDSDGWDRAIFVAEDITRASGLFTTLAGPVAGRVAGQSTKGDLFLPGEYYARRTKYAPAQFSPYGTYQRFDGFGNLKQVTTYDRFGNRIRQYDVGPGTRHGEGYHTFEYDQTNPRQSSGGGRQSKHIIF
ncbi:MAG: hypothetical protein IPN69_20765 [Acidobacteria bacterium]|nr:hypothetical protein [Acidobacteriota bacterium]